MPNPKLPQAVIDQLKNKAEDRQQARVWSTADATQAELERICRDIARYSGCKLISNGTKSLSSATRKVNGQCDGHWLQIGDIARVTLAAEKDSEVRSAAMQLGLMTASEGFTWIKKEPKNAATDPCGYSGWNGVLRFGIEQASAKKPAPAALDKLERLRANILGPRSVGSQLRANMTESQISAAMYKPTNLLLSRARAEIRQGGFVGRFAEIQVNTYDLLYGKMSRGDYQDMFGKERWETCFERTGIQGGIGHLFYEDYRVDKLSPRGQYIANLSKRYYSRMRGTDPKPLAGIDQLKNEVDDYVERSKDVRKYTKGADGRWNIVI